MSVLYEYFAATGDEDAGAILSWPGGPSSPPAGTEAKDAVLVKGIEPTVMLGTFEELLTGRAYDDITANPRHAALVAGQEPYEQMVLSISDDFRTTVTRASDATIAELVHPWSRTEEFQGDAEPEDLHAFLTALRDLAVRADQRGDQLYCWVCL